MNDESVLETFDLNLLRVLEALLLEGSVSKAAVRLRKTQPAVSNALARLRRGLGDPLFLRGPDGMVATPRARRLAVPLGLALGQLRRALEPPPRFDPTSAARTFVISASDHAQLLVAPALSKRLQAWPSVRLRFVPLHDFPARPLERGEVDLVLGIFDVAPGDRAPSGFRRKLLWEERLFLVARTGHPALKLTDGALLGLPQVDVAPRGGGDGALSRQLRKEGLSQRNIVLAVPHYLAVPYVLVSTDLVAALPERIAQRFCEVFALERRLLHGVSRTLKVHQLWHPTVQEDPGHRWLRAEISAATRARADPAQG